MFISKKRLQKLEQEISDLKDEVMYSWFCQSSPTSRWVHVSTRDVLWQILKHLKLKVKYIARSPEAVELVSVRESKDEK